MSFVLEGSEESESTETQTGPLVQNTRNRLAEKDLNNKEAAGGELSTKTVKAVTQSKEDTTEPRRETL